MAVVKFTNSKHSLRSLEAYITKVEKTDEKLVSGKDCMPLSACEEMMTVKNMFGKNHGRQYIHLVQSFDKNDPVDHSKAHNIGLKMADYFTGFQVLVATHKDKKHIHNHLLINSVNFETGLKFQQSKNDMEKIKDFSDDLCRDAGLSVIEHRSGGYISQAEYKVALKGESWKWRLIGTIDMALKEVQSKSEFIFLMQHYGYDVKWVDNRKNITFITPEGFKCRDNKLHDKKFTKEEIENGFIRNKDINKKIISTNEQGSDLSRPKRRINKDYDRSR